MKYKRYLWIPLTIILVILLSGYLLFQLSKSRTFQFFGGLTSRVTTGEKVVALTFDDAPTTFTPDVLKTLAEKQVKATFYIIGSELQKYPEIGRQMVLEGHELGNHSFSHQRFLLKSQQYIDSEIQKTNHLIRQIGYSGEITFRPPNGKKLIGLPWYLSQHHIKTIMWDVEPDTYESGDKEPKATTEFLVNFTTVNTRPGSIILLHPFCSNCQSDRDALSKIIDALKARNYKFVTVSELLTYSGK